MGRISLLRAMESSGAKALLEGGLEQKMMLGDQYVESSVDAATLANKQ